MWIITDIGSFSVVQKHSDDQFLTVRSRVRKDLDNLRDRYIHSLGPTIEGGGTDYSYRAIAPHADVAEGISKAVRKIEYGNFKDQVEVTQGVPRAKLYSKLWEVLYQLQWDEEQYNPPAG